MDSTAAAALVPLVSRRFHSFAEAAEISLNDLARSLPGTVLLGQLDGDESLCRVTDVRGDDARGINRNSVLPLAETVNGDGRPDNLQPEQWLDGQFLLSLGLESWLTLPLEMSDGHVVGLVCAVSPEPDAYRLEHGVLMAVASRLLSYEWEEVLARAELRQLRQQLRDGKRTDPDTAMPNRNSFLETLAREFKLAKRGTVHSTVLVCRVRVLSAPSGDPGPMRTLAIKDAAAVLSGATRETDHVARVSDSALATVLVGCDTGHETEAFIKRFEAAFARATYGRPISIEISYGRRSLADCDSAEDALSGAEESADAQAAD